MKKLLAPILIVSALSILGTVQVQAATVTTPSFKFNYPDEWTIYKEGNRFNHWMTIIELSPVSNTNINVGQVPYAEMTDDELIETINKITATTAEKRGGEATVFESGIDKYVVGNSTAPYAINTVSCGTYSYNCEPLVDMAVIVTLQNNNRILFQYIASDNEFDKHLSEAEAVLKSITPTNGAPT